MIVFLWLGNVVMGQYSVCPDPSTRFYQDCRSCIDNGWTWVDDECSGEKLDEETTSSAQNVAEWKCSKEWALRDEDNSKNTIAWCDCVEWFKQVGDKCLDCNLESVCCGVELNTKVPFIGKCIEDESYGGVSSEKAFPTLMWALTQILVTIILIVSFVLIIVGGIMIATGNPSWGKKMIMKVVIGIALLWASGVILRLINPNFFG